MRRISIVFVLVTALISMLALPALADGTKITGWSLFGSSPNGSPRERALYDIIQRFTAETGIEVEIETLPWQEVDSKLLTSVQGGSPPDFSWTNYFWLHQQAEAGTLMPLGPFIEDSALADELDDFILWDATVVDEEKWSMSTSFTAKALIIRKDWLDEAGLDVPETWDDFFEVAQAFTDGQRYGFAFGASSRQPNQSEMLLQGIIEGFGGNILDEDGRAVFNSEAGVQAFEMFRDLVHVHRVVPIDVVSMTYDDVTDAFESGRYGMIIDGSHRFSRIIEMIGKDNIVMARIPGVTPGDGGSTNVLGGWGLGIPVGSKNPEAAWKFIEYFSSTEAQAINARLGGEFPVRETAFEDPFFASEEGEHLLWWLDYVNERGVMTHNPQQFTQLNEILAEGLQQVILNPRADVQQILDHLVDDYNRLR